MRALRVDFIADNQPKGWGRLLAAAGILLALIGWQGYAAIQHQTEAVQSALAEASKQAGLAPSRQPRQASSPATQHAMQQARSLADFLQIPWGDLFAGLEAASSPDFALLGIEPDARKRQLKLTAEADSRDAVFDYMQRLEATPQFSHVILLKHEKQQEQAEQPWRVVLIATWHDMPISIPLETSQVAP
ncbi:PilN domain-containing protein [Methylovorus glucosotrophus]|uniref:Uncharacterized protein n=1 Tax=Methylovorus glucosotrophus (strain SIP3-4) TaxID=582744 RepID=C6XCK0_METGS|nr:PilN domain-containing protein [Methylovorus glucosotrophus]ACT50275.1 conserved hypothetical protein [Methylovorus glucosotrophus SIP3-4]